MYSILYIVLGLAEWGYSCINNNMMMTMMFIRLINIDYMDKLALTLNLILQKYDILHQTTLL